MCVCEFLCTKLCTPALPTSNDTLTHICSTFFYTQALEAIPMTTIHPRTTARLVQTCACSKMPSRVTAILHLPQRICAEDQNCQGFNYDPKLNYGTCHYKANINKPFVNPHPEGVYCIYITPSINVFQASLRLLSHPKAVATSYGYKTSAPTQTNHNLLCRSA